MRLSDSKEGYCGVCQDCKDKVWAAACEAGRVELGFECLDEGRRGRLVLDVSLLPANPDSDSPRRRQKVSLRPCRLQLSEARNSAPPAWRNYDTA
jgi:hypothetical protein